MPRINPRKNPETVRRLQDFGIAKSTAERVADLPPEMLWSKWSGLGQFRDDRSGFPDRIQNHLARINRENGLDEFDGHAYRLMYFIFVKEQEPDFAESLVDYTDPSEWKKRLRRRNLPKRSRGNRRAYKD